ncbi:MAG: tRNA (guanosine(37)-N1)-methyltransferase TrmD [Oscillospiraceae bacterium]|nr:tRNA (guanosine(37)-N1)-methyltransferase TrmD [Oscillospiraceae bacterium]
MKINIATLFPDMCETVLNTSIIGRARKEGLFEVKTYNIRDYTLNKQKNVDDRPYGGGPGMVMMTQPIYDCVKAIEHDSGEDTFVIFTTARGKTFNQDLAKELLKKPNITIVCGHYEGFDERIIEEIGDMEISVGDFVLTGGELPALIITDAVCRMIPGVLSSEEGFMQESHFNGLLEHAQYTRPYDWHGMTVPDILLSGDHGKIADYKFKDALERTKAKRPDLYEKYMQNDINVEK